MSPLLALWVACAPAPAPAPDALDVAWGTVQAQRPLLHAAEASLGAVPEPAPVGPAPLDGREAGVTLAHGRVVLEGVRAEYRTGIDETAWAAAASAALGVAEAPRPEAAVEAAIAAGRAESDAVVLGVEAALAALDPYTRPVWPVQVAGWEQHHDGVVVGIGAEVDVLAPGEVAVRTVGPGGPALATGLHQGDVLLAIDDVPVAGLDDARARLAGAPGTGVALEVRRGDAPLTFEVPREAVPQETVMGWRRAEGSEGFVLDLPHVPGGIYLRVSAFRPDTDEALLALVDAHGGPVDAVVLDLRGNGGGDVQAAVNVVDAWLDEGTVATMTGRRAPRPEPPEPGVLAWNQAAPGGPFVGRPTVVLVDQGTASAAEIVAGALQQLAGAHVIGAPTVGKGASQALRGDAGLGVAWQVTNLAWALPDGTVLAAGQGIVPDEALVPSLGERWQVHHQAQRREHPTVHADGSPQTWRGATVRPELPTLAGDPGVLAAERWLRAQGLAQGD